MAEIYTCICGDQYFLIMDGAKICCKKCGKSYELMWDVGIDGQVETPKEFNERIKPEEHGGLVAVQKSFTKKLIDDKEE